MSQYWEWLKSYRKDILGPASSEFMRSMPDTLLFGTGFLAMITQSFPLGIYFLAMLELCLLQYSIGSLTTSFSGSMTDEGMSRCSPGIAGSSSISLASQILKHTTFPSPSIWLVSGAIFYSLFSTFNFRQELNELSKRTSTWKGRLPASITFAFLIWIVYIAYRVGTGCDSTLPALGTAVAGMAAGGIIYLFHTYLFGRDAINFMGVPLLADRAAEGRPLYVCAKPETQ